MNKNKIITITILVVAIFLIGKIGIWILNATQPFWEAVAPLFAVAFVIFLIYMGYLIFVKKGV